MRLFLIALLFAISYAQTEGGGVVQVTSGTCESNGHVSITNKGECTKLGCDKPYPCMTSIASACFWKFGKPGVPCPVNGACSNRPSGCWLQNGNPTFTEDCGECSTQYPCVCKIGSGPSTTSSDGDFDQFSGYCVDKDSNDLNLVNFGGLSLKDCKQECRQRLECSGIEFYAARKNRCYLVTESRKATHAAVYAGAICYVKIPSTVTTSTTTQYIADTKAPSAVECTEESCASRAAEMDLPFLSVHKSNGAPRGCVKYKDKMIWSRNCINHPNCGTTKCNGCEIIAACPAPDTTVQPSHDPTPLPIEMETSGMPTTSSIPECTCSDYPDNAADGDKMCEVTMFGSCSPALFAFYESGCPLTGMFTPCILSIEDTTVQPSQDPIPECTCSDYPGNAVDGNKLCEFTMTSSCYSFNAFSSGCSSTLTPCILSIADTTVQPSHDPTPSPIEMETSGMPDTDACQGNRDTYNAGWGKCETYSGHNKKYCHSDSDGAHYANQVCSECGSCVDSGSGTPDTTSAPSWTTTIQLTQTPSTTKPDYPAFCSYPQWTLPETGKDTRCDHADGCPKRPEPSCDGIYGISEGQSCDVTCADGTAGSETYVCSKGATKWDFSWVLTSEPLVCGASTTTASIVDTAAPSGDCNDECSVDQKMAVVHEIAASTSSECVTLMATMNEDSEGPSDDQICSCLSSGHDFSSISSYNCKMSCEDVQDVSVYVAGNGICSGSDSTNGEGTNVEVDGVICPGQPAENFCDGDGDCVDHPEWCSCAEAQALCSSCDLCVSQFMNIGGCQCWKDESCDEDSLIPQGCDHCGQQAAEACGVTCDLCVSHFMNNDGCQCWKDESCDTGPLIPQGCDHCEEQAAEACGMNEPEEPSMDEFDCNDECSYEQKNTVLNEIIAAATSLECATLLHITMNEDSEGPSNDQICSCLSSGHDFSSISSYNCKMSCEDVQDVSVYVAGNGACSDSSSNNYVEITSESCEYFGMKSIMNKDDCKPAYKSIHDTSVVFITLGQGVNNLHDKTQGCQLFYEPSLMTGAMEWNLYFTVQPEANQDCSETRKCYCSVETQMTTTSSAWSTTSSSWYFTSSAATTGSPNGGMCVGNSATFNAGYGECHTYLPGSSNFNYCHSDYNGMYYAKQVCQECGQCTGSSNGDEAEESMDEFDCNDECSVDQKMAVLNEIMASTSSECATLMATMNEDSEGPSDDQICSCLSSGHDFSSISSYNCKMSCEDVQDVSVYVAGNGICSGSDSNCNDECSEDQKMTVLNEIMASTSSECATLMATMSSEDSDGPNDDQICSCLSSGHDFSSISSYNCKMSCEDVQDVSVYVAGNGVCSGSDSTTTTSSAWDFTSSAATTGTTTSSAWSTWYFTSSAATTGNPSGTMCVGDSATFDAGYGKCHTYSPGSSNFNYCHSDYNGMYYAQQVCQECGKCAGSSNGDETEESMDEFDCNDECSDDQKTTVLNLISASTSSECATLMAITMNEDSDGPTDDQICGCLSSGHDFSSISSYNCKMSCEDIQDVSVYVAGNGTCSGSDSKCNDPCPVGYFKDATYDTMCIGDNWNGNYCSLCGGDNGGWVMDPCSMISGETTDSPGGAETTESAECKEVLLDASKYLYFVCANMDYNGLTRAEVCPNLGTDYWSQLTPEQVISVQDCCCQEYEESLTSEEENAINFVQQVVDSSAGDLVILGFAAIGVFAMFATAYRMLKKDDEYNLISEEDL